MPKQVSNQNLMPLIPESTSITTYAQSVSPLKMCNANPINLDTVVYTTYCVGMADLSVNFTSILDCY